MNKLGHPPASESERPALNESVTTRQDKAASYQLHQSFKRIYLYAVKEIKRLSTYTCIQIM
jgi:hypothetical protein